MIDRDYKPQDTPPIIGWARPLGFAPTRYCAVLSIDPVGSVITACRGRWRSAEPTHFVAGRDRDYDDDGHRLQKCGACEEHAAAKSANGKESKPATPAGLDSGGGS